MKKTLQELTLKSNFMFAATMMNPDNCKDLLERVLEINIDHVIVNTEQSMVYHPDYKSVRLDVYAKDNKGSHFNVEMQVAKEEIRKRARYYHSQMDMQLILSGEDYRKLPNSYVIFLCDFDPFDGGKYRYTVKNSFKENLEEDYDDGSYTVFLSTKGSNDYEVPQELVKFLKYLGSDLEHSEDDFGDEYVRRLQKSVQTIKQDREMEGNYMLVSELMEIEFQNGKAEGKADSILVLLSGLCQVPNDIKENIYAIHDESRLDSLLKFAATSTSMDEFKSKANL